MSDIVENGWKALNYRTLVGLPTRSLGAVDEFMKTLRYRAVVQAKASVEAAEQGLTGGELQAFIERRLADAFDADGRAIDAAAIKDAETATFQQELLSGTAGKAIQSFRENLPVTALILPFVKTPINVLRYAWKMSPGLNLLQKEYREMLRGKIGTEAQAHAIGQVALGATFMALAGTLAASGRVTGSGPKDPALLASLKATGWQPNSLTWEDGNGERHYFSLGRFDPIALPMVMVADLVDLQRMGASDHQVASASATVALSLAKSFEDRTFLQNLNAALQAASDPENRLERYSGQTAGNAMPFSSLLREVNPDPYMRETRSFLDSILSKVPAFSEGLPPARDAFGEPRWQRIGLATREDADVVEAEHTRIILNTDFGLRLPDPVRNGVDLRTVTLSNGRNAYDLFQEYVATPPSGPGLKTTLAKLIQSDGYDRLVDGDPSAKGTKLGAMMDVVVRYREAAMARLRAEFPELRAALSQRQLDVTGRLKAKQTEAAKPTDTEALLKALGY